jgi:hypothetical protein
VKGRWFPDWRTGTRAQCAALQQAAYNLFRHSRYEQKAGIREETPHWNDLNDRYNTAERGLTRAQISYHRHKAGTREDKDFYRLQRQADQQRKQARVMDVTGLKDHHALDDAIGQGRLFMRLLEYAASLGPATGPDGHIMATTQETS